MKRSKMLVVVLALLLMALIPVLASAQSADRPDQIGTGQMTIGQPFVLNAPARDGAQPTSPAKSAVLPSTAAEKLGVASNPNAPSWVVKEGFEGFWPTGLWYTFDNNGSGNGSYCWDDESWIAKKGFWSGWGAGGCADALDPYYDYYAPNMESWMVYGPFSTVGAKKGSLSFKYWLDGDPGYDFLWWCVSTDGSSFWCYNTSNNTNYKWKTGKINLKNAPVLGNVLGDSSVWVAWVWTSDGIIENDGAFVDEVKLTVK